MCETCEALGLSRQCQTCGGFDWVSDVYLDADAPVKFRLRLCGECRKAWSVVVERGGG
jgi:hypothetical protein